MSTPVKAAPFKWVPTWRDSLAKFKERMDAHRRANGWPTIQEKQDVERDSSNRDR